MNEEASESIRSVSQVDTAAYQTETYNDEDDSFETGSDYFSEESSDDDESSEECSVEAENNKEDDEAAEIMSIARRDTAHVRRWRMVVLMMIVCTGAVLTGGTYLVLKNEQFDDALRRVSAHYLSRLLLSRAMGLQKVLSICRKRSATTFSVF